VLRNAPPYASRARESNPLRLHLHVAHDGSWSRMLAGNYPRDMVALSVWMSDTCCDDCAVVGKGSEAIGDLSCFWGFGSCFHATMPWACDITWGTKI